MAKRDLLIKLFRKLPLQNTVILESSPDYSDNTYYFFQYLLQRGLNKKYKFVWFLNKEYDNYPAYDNVEYLYRNSTAGKDILKRLYYETTAKFIFDCNAYVYKQRDDQVRIHLTHGDPLKYASGYMSLMGNVDGVLTSSKCFTDYYETIGGCSEEQVLPLGMPRNTVFNEGRSYDKNTIIWMPTYRKHQNGFGMDEEIGNFWNGMPAVHSEQEFAELLGLLDEKGITIYYRPHPAQDVSHFQMNQSSHFIIVDNDYLKKNNMLLYEFIAGCGALITDYSSIYEDFQLTNRPIGLTIEDKEEYVKVFGLIYDKLEDGIKGDFIYNFNDLLAFINNYADGIDKSKEERLKNKLEHHDLIDCNYSEVLYNYMAEKYGF